MQNPRHSPNRVTDCVHLAGESQDNFSTSTTAAQSAALAGGVYDVWAAEDTYIKVAATANDVTVATGYLIPANQIIPVYVPKDHKIGGILATGTGTLRFHRVG